MARAPTPRKIVTSLLAFLSTPESILKGTFFPAVDILNSTSSALNREIVGERHYKAQIAAQSLIKKALTLERVVSLIGESELSASDQIIYRRAKILSNYFTQNFHTTELQTGKKGSYVTLPETIIDVEQILSGRYDDVPSQSFMGVGSLKDLMKS